MNRSLPILRSATSSPTCVWMEAGLVSYRLCNRGFACEHCPFDAAMRGQPMGDSQDGGLEARPALLFPADRLYSDAHVWVQNIHDGRVRTGIDAYAARMLHPISGITSLARVSPWKRGDPWCLVRIAGGEVPLAMPVSGHGCVWNSALEASPALASREPYGDGWIAEFSVGDPRDLDMLVDADKAAAGAALDARQFRRALAFRLLSSAARVHPLLDGSFLDHARTLIDPAAFVSLARECVH